MNIVVILLALQTALYGPTAGFNQIGRVYAQIGDNLPKSFIVEGEARSCGFRAKLAVRYTMDRNKNWSAYHPAPTPSSLTAATFYQFYPDPTQGEGFYLVNWADVYRDDSRLRRLQEQEPLARFDCGINSYQDLFSFPE